MMDESYESSISLSLKVMSWCWVYYEDLRLVL